VVSDASKSEQQAVRVQSVEVQPRVVESEPVVADDPKSEQQAVRVQGGEVKSVVAEVSKSGQQAVRVQSREVVSDASKSEQQAVRVQSGEVKPVGAQPAVRLDGEADVSNAAAAMSVSHSRSEKVSVEEVDHESEQEFDSIPLTTGLVNEAVVVKTVEKQTAAPVNVHGAEVVQQVVSQMKVKIKSGNTSMRLQLNPKDLGGIEVQMVKSAEGVSVTFFAEQASTGHLLETQMNQLRQSLKDAGVQLTGLNVGQQDQPKQEGGFFRQDRYFGQDFQRSVPRTGMIGKEMERTEEVVRSATEIDYLI
jgi:flagellar hook-length control protein FliK